MTAHVKVGGVWRTLTPKFKVGGAWKTATGGWVKVAGVWRKFYSSVTASISPTSQAAGPSTNTTWTFSPTTLTVTGSTVASYAWSCSDDGSPGNWAISAGQGTATVTVRVSSTLASELHTCELQCVATLTGGGTVTGSAPLSYQRT